MAEKCQITRFSSAILTLQTENVWFVFLAARNTFMTSNEDTADEYLPDPKVCERYHVSSMTLWRWDRNSDLGFPGPIRINRRKYRSRRQLEAWERTRVGGAK
jgi:hypothetical protein